MTSRMPAACTAICATICGFGMTDLPAQNFLSYLPNGATSQFHETPALSIGWGGAGPGILRPAMAAPARPVPPALRGAVAVDNAADIIYSTNGNVAAGIQRRRYPRLGCGGGTVLADLAVPAFIPFITGMAVDPATQHLFLTDGIQIVRWNPAAGGGGFVCNWPAMTPTQLTGLAFDTATPGVLWGVTTAGVVVRYAMCGGLAGVFPPAYAPPSQATGIAVDKSDGRINVLHRSGEVFDHAAGVLADAGVAGRVGLSYIATPIYLPSAGACGGTALVASPAALAVEGSATFGITACGFPAGAPSAVMIQLPPSAAFALVPIGGIWLVPGSVSVAVAIPAGGTVPLPLPVGLAGYTFVAQGFALCGGALTASNALHVAVSR